MKKIIKKVRYIIFNRQKGTRIESINASLKAIYGYNVGIAYNTFVSDDVKIGDYSYINSNSYIENCEIGKFCSISSGVYISPFEHNYHNKTTHPFLYNSLYGFIKENPKLQRKKVVIGNDVLISLNAIIKEGVIIGDGAVIGAGAVVTKDVAPYEIVGGVPARHLKFRFDSDDISKLRSEKFWEWEREKIINNIDYLMNKIEKIK